MHLGGGFSSGHKWRSLGGRRGVRAFEAASGRKVAYQIVEGRPGDIANCYADPSLAFELLDWRATRGIDEMCEVAPVVWTRRIGFNL